MGTKGMTIKLMLDPESKKLIFAEASKDFVDFLIFILSLPIGTVTRLLSSESMVGSIGNIYKSVANLDETYMRQNVDKGNILCPTSFSSPTNIPLSGSSMNIPKLYTCSDPNCNSGFRNVNHGVECPDCDGTMSKSIEYIDSDSKGYVKSMASYMIYDDLSIAPLSTMSIVSMMTKFNVTKLEERAVIIAKKEALELLKASFQSTTVLTDVFLNTKKRKRPDIVQIFVKAEKTLTLQVKLSDTIGDLKAKILDKSVFYPRYLVYCGMLLNQDFRTLDSYNIQKESTIHMF